MMASKTLSWARKHNLFNQTLSSSLKCSHQKASTESPDTQGEMQLEQNATDHMGSSLQARDPDFVFGALKVSFTKGERKQWQGNKGKVKVAMYSKGERMPQKTVSKQGKRGEEDRAQVSADGAATSTQQLLTDGAPYLRILFTTGWLKTASGKGNPST